MPTKVWAVGEEVLAADFNTYVQQQVVSTFASLGALQTAWPDAPLGAQAVVTDTFIRYTKRAAGGAGWIENGPRGLIISRSLTASSGNVTTETALPALAFTLNAVAGRCYRLEFQSLLAGTVAGDRHILQVKDGATILQTWNGYAPSIANAPYSIGGYALLPALAGGAHAITVTMQRFSGTGTVQMVASASAPTWISVEDVGVPA